MNEKKEKGRLLKEKKEKEKEERVKLGKRERKTMPWAIPTCCVNVILREERSQCLTTLSTLHSTSTTLITLHYTTLQSTSTILTPLHNTTLYLYSFSSCPEGKEGIIGIQGQECGCIPMGKPC